MLNTARMSSSADADRRKGSVSAGKAANPHLPGAKNHGENYAKNRAENHAKNRVETTQRTAEETTQRIMQEAT